MAEDPSKAPSPVSAQASISAVDGSTDQPSNATAGIASGPPSKPAQDGEGDLIMTSPTAPTMAAAASVSTPSNSATAFTTTLPTTGPVPLDSALRTTPIHPSLPSVKVPAEALISAPNMSPITLQPFTEAELNKYGFEKLRAQVLAAAEKNNNASHLPAANGEVGLSEQEKEEISRVREETAALLKRKLDEREARLREIEREMEEKEKIREVERKVFRKKLGGGKEV
ncbi:uncharacterized protein Z519_03540 [Cladophialophora bantiana CBS 173.52]|uniref:Uncharacterized protein n=1 Tax=Cladophialophora bantiana (strain ATCC 10958 / CBS 173.52 / CDC B-1940 / NIH 8579) TaxID=1442370 RepID=A0A0D2F2R0_CLAB1|nr:uncharacterized protein Z519_03540 [Cladophialophora bantiana CBS 173.52]KIW96471.1 hypothetical protein Z519_03540 [Cladophialophora bantiana CBS 173.52]